MSTPASRRPSARTGRRRPSLPGRRTEFSASTKRRLVEVALALFTDQGYAGTSLDAIVDGADVTKGALYHHFTGKRALFEAVFDQVESDSVTAIRRELKQHKDPWERVVAGLRAFIDVVQQPEYRRIVVLEGPAVLGHEQIREHTERSSYTVVRDLVAYVLADQGDDIDPVLLESFSTIFFGAFSSAGEFIADSADPAAASLRVEIAAGYIVGGLRLLQEAGVSLPSASEMERPAEQVGIDPSEPPSPESPDPA